MIRAKAAAKLADIERKNKEDAERVRNESAAAAAALEKKRRELEARVVSRVERC